MARPKDFPNSLSASTNWANGMFNVSISATMTMAKYSLSTLCEISTIFAPHSAHFALTRAIMPTLSLPVTVITASNPFPDQTCCRYFCMLFVLLLVYRSVCFVLGKTTCVTVLPQRPFACVWYQLGIGTQHRNIIIYIFHYSIAFSLIFQSLSRYLPIFSRKT